MNVTYATTREKHYIKLFQQGAFLMAGPAEASLEELESTSIESVTPQTVVLKTTSGTLYTIPASAYWRVWHGNGAEPDTIWCGVMEASSAKSRQDAATEEMLLINSAPTPISKLDVLCAFGPFDNEGKRQHCGKRAKLVHITEDLRRPGAFVILPICGECNQRRLEALFADPGQREPEDTMYLSEQQVKALSGGVLYPVSEEG